MRDGAACDIERDLGEAHCCDVLNVLLPGDDRTSPARYSAPLVVPV